MLQLDNYPSGILATGDVIWGEDHAHSNRVYAIDPITGKSLAAIEVSRPCDLAATAKRIWVADLGTGQLLWIDPATRAIAGHIEGLGRPCGPVAPDGVIWLAIQDGVARVDPATEKVTTTKLSGPAFPGAGKPLWAAGDDAGDLFRIDPPSGEVQRTVKAPGGAVQGPPIAAGLKALWYGNGSTERVYRLDPLTAAIRAEIATDVPTRLLVTADSVWLTSFDGGMVERIDPATNKVVYRAHLGGNPNGMTEGFGGVWVSDTGRGRLYRFDPAATGISN